MKCFFQVTISVREMCSLINYRMTDHYPFFQSSSLTDVICLTYLSDHVIYIIYHAIDGGNVNIRVQKEATRIAKVKI